MTARPGLVERDGVRIAYELHDNPGRPAVVLLPTWALLPSRHWRLQVPHLARHFRVVTFDGRGSGASDRPVGAAAYTDAEHVADTIAVMDAAGVGEAVLVGLSCGVGWALRAAADHPGRVAGVVAIAPSCGVDVPQPDRDEFPWDAEPGTTDGWAKYNRRYWLDGGYPDFVDWFVARMFPEPHSTKQIEDCVAWAHEIAPATLVDATAGRLLPGVPMADVCPRVRCPVLVIHGTDDRVRAPAVGARVAELTGGSLVLLDGAGHGPHARHPVEVNRLVRAFVDDLAPRAGAAPGDLAPVVGQAPRADRTPPARVRRRPPRALFLCSPIGLGHARRDLAVAAELRARRPGLRIDWLTQHPVTAVLDAAGERLHPASAWLANESAHVEHEAGEHDLHAFEAIRRMDAVLVQNFMVFDEVVADGDHDLVVADEAWDVDHFLHENPRLKRFPFAWLTDFVGWLPMPDGDDRERRLTADRNAEMLGHRARLRHVRDRSVFVGDPADVVDESFGPGLPRIRDWVGEHFDFAGHITGFAPPSEADRAAARAAAGVAPGERLCVVAVGGSGVGGHLARRVLDAAPRVRALVPGLRLVVVTGPRIDPRSLPATDGVTLRGHVPDLHVLLAACDVAVVQGGLTTCMELVAARRPFLYVPLRNHFEQQVHVHHRLRNHRAGRRTTYDEVTDPDALAAAVADELRRPVDYAPVATDGAARAAGLIAELL